MGPVPPTGSLNFTLINTRRHYVNLTLFCSSSWDLGRLVMIEPMRASERVCSAKLVTQRRWKRLGRQFAV
jgi:hypothetical protein